MTNPKTIAQIMDKLRGGPRVEPAREVLQRLEKEAEKADWAGKFKEADAIRKEITRIKQAGSDYVPNF